MEDHFKTACGHQSIPKKLEGDKYIELNKYHNTMNRLCTVSHLWGALDLQTVLLYECHKLIYRLRKYHCDVVHTSSLLQLKKALTCLKISPVQIWNQRPLTENWLGQDGPPTRGKKEHKIGMEHFNNKSKLPLNPPTDPEISLAIPTSKHVHYPEFWL